MNENVVTAALKVVAKFAEEMEDDARKKDRIKEATAFGAIAAMLVDAAAGKKSFLFHELETRNSGKSDTTDMAAAKENSARVAILAMVDLDWSR